MLNNHILPNDPRPARDAGKTNLPLGVAFVLAYLVAACVLAVYVAIACWPQLDEKGEIVGPHSVPLLLSSIRPVKDQYHQLVALSVGCLGGVLHCLRSFYWYVGNGEFRTRWIFFYVLVPVTSGILGLAFFFILRGGLLTATASSGNTNPYGIAAISFVIGLFSQQAILKLKDVAETLLVTPQPGKDSVVQETVPETAPGFSLDADPPTQKPNAAGDPAVYHVRVVAFGGFAEPVEFSLRGLPDGFAGAFLPPTAIPSPTGIETVLTVATQGLPAGGYPLEIVAVSVTKSQTAKVELVVA